MMRLHCRQPTRVRSSTRAYICAIAAARGGHAATRSAAMCRPRAARPGARGCQWGRVQLTCGGTAALRLTALGPRRPR